MVAFKELLEVLVPVMVAIVTGISGVLVAKMSAVQKDIKVGKDKSRTDNDTIGSRVDALAKQMDHVITTQAEDVTLHSSIISHIHDIDRRINVIEAYLIKRGQTENV